MVCWKHRRRLGAICLGLLALILPAASPAVARTAAGLRVRYSGAGSYKTSYDAHAPNPGGAPDHDTAMDTETERWSLRFTQPLRSGHCPPSGCVLTAATGTTHIAGRIHHVHVDGLYAQLDRSVRCRIQAGTTSRASPGASLQYRGVDHGRTLSVTVLNPVATALLLLPSACPGQGDSIDGLDDNYLGPGFSFADGWGPARWFTSRTVVVSLARLHRRGTIRIRLSQTRRGTPPAGCAAPYAWQRCRTGGSWNGVLTLAARR
jgi:hypothetical protein